MKFKFLFAWYDLWIGAFIDRPRFRLYIFPLPMIGIVIDFPMTMPWRTVWTGTAFASQHTQTGERRTTPAMTQQTAHVQTEILNSL